MKNSIIILIFILLCSCGDIDFVYKDKKNLVNPLYQKTNVDTSGVDINFLNSYLPMFFGDNKENIFSLLINIEERKTKRSIETNQVTSNLRYELRFFYTLTLNKENCVKKFPSSYFSNSLTGFVMGLCLPLWG